MQRMIWPSYSTRQPAGAYSRLLRSQNRRMLSLLWKFADSSMVAPPEPSSSSCVLLFAASIGTVGTNRGLAERGVLAVMRRTHGALLMTSIISAAISSTVCVAVLRANLSASEGLY